MSTQHSFLIPGPRGELCATLFLPRQVKGALLCLAPLAEERKGALPFYVGLARHLSGCEIATLLFDFSGSGDSAGEFESLPPERFHSEALIAWQWLQEHLPGIPAAILGVRCAALLAQHLAAAVNPAALLLLAPITGADFTGQLLKRQMINSMIAYGQAQNSREQMLAEWQTGRSVDLDGYTFSAACYEWLCQLEPSASPPAVPLLLAGDGHSDLTRLATSTAHRLPLRFPPFWNTVGQVNLQALTEACADWLRSEWQHFKAQPAPLNKPLKATAATIRLSEMAPADAPLSTVWDLPQGAPAGAVLMLHGWSGDRSGPHRLFTHFGRQLSERGILVLRPDLHGRGLSAGTPANSSIASMTDSARQALSALRRELPPQTPISLIAICSGCKIAITLAAENPDLQHLALWSAEAMGSLRASTTRARKIIGNLRIYATKLKQPETWRKLLRGQVQGAMVQKALVQSEVRSAAEAQREDLILQRFKAFRNPVLFIYGGSDPDAPLSLRRYSAFCQKQRIPFKGNWIEHAGHSFYSAAWTQRLCALTLEFLYPCKQTSKE